MRSASEALSSPTIDAGTCITYDCVDTAGNYLGGGISPGLAMRFPRISRIRRDKPAHEIVQALYKAVREFVSRALRQDGHEVTAVGDGQQAVDRARELGEQEQIALFRRALEPRPPLL